MAKYRDEEDPFAIINNWMRSRSTIEFLGLWEKLSNPDFKPIEFERFRSEAGSNYFVLSPNIRDYADVSQLVCLSNLENLNALFIQENAPQAERLGKLNRIAIHQMKLLTDNPSIKRLEAKDK